MRRRDVLSIVPSILGGVVICGPIVAWAQRSDQMRRIAVLMAPADNDTEGQARVRALGERLNELGWVEGSNMRSEYRWFAGDRDRAQAYARELVDTSPSIIVVSSTLGLSAARQATDKIPIVFLLVGDPVGQGFVKSLAHPGGNITGFTAFEFEIGGKWLQLMKELVPDVSRVGVLFNPEAGPYARNFMQTMAPVATASGIEVIAGPTLHADGIEPFIASLAQGTKAGLIVTPDAFTATNDSLIVSLAANHRLPSVYAYQYSARRGGLLSYGHSTADVFRQGAEYVDKILRGANPADLPVQTPSRFELCINVKAAKALGIDIPPSLLARANEIIE